jgi:hypothetical protein
MTVLGGSQEVLRKLPGSTRRGTGDFNRFYEATGSTQEAPMKTQEAPRRNPMRSQKASRILP